MNDKKKYLVAVLLTVSILIAFGRIVGNDFTSYDDSRLITQNSFIQEGFTAKSIKWAFTDLDHEYWHPLTSLCLMLEWRLFGDNARGYHLISLLLHAGTSVFFFLFLFKATKSFWPSVFAAAFFALHPLRVESVAWASERKDVLSMFFGMVTLYTYVHYTEKPSSLRYLTCLMLFILSIMSKPMLVTVPFILLLLDYWPLKRLEGHPAEKNAPVAGQYPEAHNQDTGGSINEKTGFEGNLARIPYILLEKGPFFLLSTLLGIVIVWQLHSSARMATLDEIAFTGRLLNALMSYFAYLEKIFSPLHLAVFYPYRHSFPLWYISCALPTLLIVSTMAFCSLRKATFLAVGWLWYLGALFPVIGFLQAGHQSIADRYTYLPSAGISIMLAWGVPLLIKNDALRKKVLLPAATIILCALSALTWNQCGYWKNDMTLSTHALHVTKNNYVAHNILAAHLYKEKKVAAAISHYNESVRINPDYHFTYNNRASLYANIGQYELSIKDLNTAIRLRPDFGAAYTNRGGIYSRLSRYREAIEDLSKAIELNPNDAAAYNNRGGVYYKLARYREAIEDYDKAVFLKSNYAVAYSNRAFALIIEGNKERGCEDARKACSLGSCHTWEVAINKGDCL